ncbi:MAG: fumarylacetoacetate hydrolase family protein, partial [Clostridia bacterium]
MKLTQFYVQNTIHLGLLRQEGILDLTTFAAHGGYCPATLAQAMEDYAGLKRFVESIPDGAPLLAPASLCYAPVVDAPEKILCTGLNYRMHAAETGDALPAYPLFFSKFSNALAAHGQAVTLPRESSQIDYEAELVVVLGKRCRDVKPEAALSYVFGYTLGNDLSARDLQMRTSQWLLGKTLDQFAPIGPFLVTADALSPQELTLTCRVNGTVRQSAPTSDMIFDCATLVSYASRFMTLRPGDLLF